MTDARSNSAAELDALLTKVKALAAEAEEYERRARESYLRARDAIIAAKKIGPKKLTSNRAIAKAIGKSPNWVDQILKEEWVATDGGTPFSGARDNRQALRKALKEDADLVVAEMLKDPKMARAVIRGVVKGLAAMKPKPAKEPPPPPKESVLFGLRDHIVMDQHVLFVGRSDNTYFKHLLLRHLGVPQGEVRNEYPERYGIETGIVVVTDPPYGQDEPGVPGDDSADHRAVYKLLRPRGGFSFCAYRPPLFREAEEGIIAAGGKPVHYLAMRTRSAHGQGPGNRLRNVLQAIIYWERKGAEPWIRARNAIDSVLMANEEARAEMSEARKHHTTPKPVNVMEQLIDLVTEEGDFVLDPFAGSGSTLIACERTRRRFIGFEMHEPYAEVTVQRWQHETKRQAVVHRSYANPPSMLFDELKAKGRWAERPGSDAE